MKNKFQGSIDIIKYSIRVNKTYETGKSNDVDLIRFIKCWYR